MSDLAITAATAILGSNTASGDLFPVVDVSASTPKGRSITRDELGTAMVATSALTTALAAKLDKAGGTMTGALTLPAGIVSAPSLLLTGAGSTTGIYSTGANSIDIAIAGVRRYWFDGINLNTSGTGLQVTGGNILGTFAYLRTNTGGALSFGTSDDVKIGRGGAAAKLQLGVDHATTATNQTIKAHNVTTGTGANLVLAGGTGSVAGGSVSLAASVTTGAPNKLIEVFPGGQIAFFGSTGSVQVNTGIAGESHSAGSGTAVTEDSTFGGYTLMQLYSVHLNHYSLRHIHIELVNSIFI